MGRKKNLARLLNTLLGMSEPMAAMIMLILKRFLQNNRNPTTREQKSKQEGRISAYAFDKG